MIETSSKVSQIFEYLLAVRNLKEKIIRSVNEYEEVWWQEKLPNFEGCYLGGNGQYQEAWLEVHKQDIPATPSLPRILSDWIKEWENPDKEPVPNPSIVAGTKINEDNQMENVIELFKDSNERIATYSSWLNNVWRPWAIEASPKKKIQKLYMELFTLHQRFQREADDIEIAWGHGLLSWKVEGENILRPFLVTKLELQFNAKKGVFLLIPTSKGTHLETDMLNNIDLPNAKRLQEMEKQLEEIELLPWDKDSLEPFLSEIVHTISPKGRYSGSELSHGPNSDSPVINYTPVIFLRESGGRLWQNELKNAIEKIKNGYPVPSSIKILTTTDPKIYNKEESQVTEREWSGVGENLLFPLPTNNEQKLIAQKLATNSGVVVQGPPGTGKSHTIVNLISHLLAHGKRVLVTSEKERALQVLRDKIPQEIRALCVSVLGGDARSVKEIEDSIRKIAENLDSLQPETLQKEINRLKHDLDLTKRNIAGYQTMINQAAETENKKVAIGDIVLDPLEAAKWLKKYERYNWFPDRVELSDSFPLSNSELNTFFKLLGTLNKDDIVSLEQNRPSIEELPSPSQFESSVIKSSNIEDKVKLSEDHIKDWSLPNSFPPTIPSLITKVTGTIENITQLNKKPWLMTILNDVVRSEERHEVWAEFVKESKERVRIIQALNRDLIEHEVELTQKVNPITLKEDLVKLKGRLKESKGLGWFFKNVSGRKYSYLVEGCLVNGLNIRNIADIDILLKELECNDIKKKLVLKWNRTMEEINGEILDSSINRFAYYVDELLVSMDSLLEWKKNVISQLEEPIIHLGHNSKKEWTELGWFEELLEGLRAIQYRIEYNEAHIFFEQTTTLLIKGKESSNAHISWSNLLNACHDKAVDAWNNEYMNLVRLEGLEGDFKLFNNFRIKLQEKAPNWVKGLQSSGGEGIPLNPPEGIEMAWKWSKCNKWIIDLQSKYNIEELQAKTERERETESRLIRELVSQSTWKAQLERTTTAQRRSLMGWLKAIQRIGKGTGKYANVYRKEASKEMNVCRGAIPVWIMPIQRVIENIELAEDLFDVVIVDESSQSDLFSISALLRAKKAVIVGDDNQISPDSVGTDISEVHQLIERYLYDIPQSKQFEMKTSLYDTASRVFDSKIMLKEHFRCVPEIIQFSNDLMYGDIDPLRLPLGHEMLSPPVKAICS